MLRHQLAQERDSVHARHLDIERDDVGHILLDTARRGEGIGGRADDLDARIGAQDVGQGLPDRGRVVDDQNADLTAHTSTCPLTLQPPEYRGGDRLERQSISGQRLGMTEKQETTRT